jgi:hypothetical protein
LAVGAVAMVAAACDGGGGIPGIAALGSKTHETTTAVAPVGSPGGGSSKVQVQLLAFVACMRKNGLPNFPGPVNGHLNLNGSGIDPSSPQLQAAQKACEALFPQLFSPAQQQREEAGLLSGSQCMRAHGVQNFPDPQFSAGGDFKLHQ